MVDAFHWLHDMYAKKLAPEARRRLDEDLIVYAKTCNDTGAGLYAGGHRERRDAIAANLRRGLATLDESSHVTWTHTSDAWQLEALGGSTDRLVLRTQARVDPTRTVPEFAWNELTRMMLPAFEVYFATTSEREAAEIRRARDWIVSNPGARLEVTYSAGRFGDREGVPLGRRLAAVAPDGRVVTLVRWQAAGAEGER